MYYNYNIGDRIIYLKRYHGIVISLYIERYERYLIRYPELKVPSGNVVEAFTRFDEIELDTQYYREDKLKKLLKNE